MKSPRVIISIGLLLLLSLTFEWAVAADLDQPAGVLKPVPAYRQADRVAILTVEGEIDLVTLSSLERRVDRALKEGADAIVLEIDTPGGRVDAALDICHLMKTEAPANSVAWIRPEAYSAGTIIGLACREIVVAPHARLGDAAPIQIDPVNGLRTLGATERAKIESPILEEVTTAAQRNGYDEKLCQSFVSVGIELWMVENIETNERAFVDRAEYRLLFGDEPPDEITPIVPGGGSTPGPVVPFVEPTVDATPAGHDANTAPEKPRATRDRFSESDRGNWRLLSQVVSDDRLLTISDADARQYGIATDTIRNEDELRAYFGASEVVRYDQNWSEGLVRILVSMPVRMILIVIFLIAFFIEMAAPGTGLFGITAAIALLALIGGPYLIGFASWWEIALIIAGILLVAVEIFLIPGLGFAGLGGAICILVGLVGTFVSGDITSAAGQTELTNGLVATIGGVMTAGIGIWLISRNLAEIKFMQRLVLRAEVGKGSQSEDLLRAVAHGPQREEITAGAVGVADTDLRPSGRATFGRNSRDVISVSGYIDRGRRVRVVNVSRFAIEVEESA